MSKHMGSGLGFNRVIATAALLVLGLTAVGTSLAQNFPSKPIRIIVPFAPGALLDTTSRFVAQKMSENLGQPVLVENRPGGDALLGVRYVKSMPADGYTLLAISSAFAQSPALKLDPGYEVKDFVGVGGMNEAALMMVTASSQPDTTLAQFLTRAKANPELLSYGSGGVGTTAWMAGALFMKQTDSKLLHVPYKGLAAAAPDVIAGRLNVIFDTAGSTGPNVKEGRLRALGVSTSKRLAAFPDIPTLAEQGVTNYNYSVYQGLLVRTGTSPEVVGRLAQALRAATLTEEFRQRNRMDSSEPLPLTAEEFTERVRQEAIRAVSVVTEMGIPKQ